MITNTLLTVIVMFISHTTFVEYQVFTTSHAFGISLPDRAIALIIPVSHFISSDYFIRASDFSFRPPPASQPALSAAAMRFLRYSHGWLSRHCHTPASLASCRRHSQ